MKKIRKFIFCAFIIEYGLLMPAGAQKKVKDFDGNIYQTIKINQQVWLAENLRSIHYSDGSPIHHVSDSAEWSNLKTGAYCWYANDSISNRKKHGALYNWYTVNSGKLCPAGWHVPTHAEWDTLTDYLKNNGFGYKGNRDEINKALATKSDWTYFSAEGTAGNDEESNNSSGFSATPSGYRYNYGKFNDMNLYGTWWSSTESIYSNLNAYSRGVYYIEGKVNRATNNKNCGFSIRCLRN